MKLNVREFLLIQINDEINKHTVEEGQLFLTAQNLINKY